MKIEDKFNKLRRDTAFNKSLMSECYRDMLKIVKDNKVVSPYVAEIFPSTLCNYSCIGCHSNKLITTKGSVLEYTMFTRLIDDLKSLGVKGILFSGGGEPLVNPRISDMIKYIKSKGLDLLIITNGYLLNDKLMEVLCKYVDIIRISFNAGNADDYRNFYGKDGFETVYRNISKLVQLKMKTNSNLNIGLKSLISVQNYSKVQEVISAANELDVDYLQFKLLRGCDSEIKDKGILEELNKELLTYQNQFKEKFDLLFELTKTHLCGKCYLHQIQPVISSNGQVYVCSYFHDKYIYGDLNKNSFIDIWNSEQHRKVIEMEKFSNCDMLDCNLHIMNNKLWEMDKKIHS